MKFNESLLIRVWTLGLTLVLILAVLFVVSVNPFENSLIYLGLLAMVTVIGLFSNIWGGLVASGVAVFSIFILNQYIGVSARESLFLNVSSELVSFLIVGPLAGALSGVIAQTQRQINHWMASTEERTTHDSHLGALKPEWAKVRLTDEILRAARYARPLSVVLVRFDHKAGTAALAALRAERLVLLQALIRVARAATQPPVVVAHASGDQVMLILPEYTPQQAQEFVDVFRTRLKDEMYFPAGKAAGDKSLGKRIGESGEIRMAIVCPDPKGETSDALIDRAKSALDAESALHETAL